MNLKSLPVRMTYDCWRRNDSADQMETSCSIYASSSGFLTSSNFKDSAQRILPPPPKGPWAVSSRFSQNSDQENGYSNGSATDDIDCGTFASLTTLTQIIPFIDTHSFTNITEIDMLPVQSPPPVTEYSIQFPDSVAEIPADSTLTENTRESFDSTTSASEGEEQGIIFAENSNIYHDFVQLNGHAQHELSTTVNFFDDKILVSTKEAAVMSLHERTSIHRCSNALKRSNSAPQRPTYIEQPPPDYSVVISETTRSNYSVNSNLSYLRPPPPYSSSSNCKMSALGPQMTVVTADMMKYPTGITPPYASTISSCSPSTTSTIETTPAMAVLSRRQTPTHENCTTFRYNRRTSDDQPRNYMCEWKGCRKAYKKKSHLKSHELTHSGEKTFMCQEPGCDKKFYRDDELKRHKRIHSGERPFPCKFCEKQFQRSDHLRSHMAGKHKLNVIEAMHLNTRSLA